MSRVGRCKCCGRTDTLWYYKQRNVFLCPQCEKSDFDKKDSLRKILRVVFFVIAALVAGALYMGLGMEAGVLDTVKTSVGTIAEPIKTLINK